MKTDQINSNRIHGFIRLALIVLVLCCSVPIWANGKSYNIEFPGKGTYSIWVQDAGGKLLILPYTVYEKERDDVSGAIAVGSVINIMDDAKGTIARCVITGNQVHEIHLKAGDFDELPLKSDEKAKATANAQSFYILPPHMRRYDALHELEPWAAVTAFILGIIICSIFVWAVHRIGKKRAKPAVETAASSFADQNITLRSSIDRNEYARLSAPLVTDSAEHTRSKTMRRKRSRNAPFLTGTQGMVAGTTFKVIAPKMTIGRDGDNDMVVAENTVSRRHAELTVNSSGNVCIKDTNSANGVFVNGERVQQAYLSNGDEIKIGDNFFEFSC